MSLFERTPVPVRRYVAGAYNDATGYYVQGTYAESTVPLSIQAAGRDAEMLIQEPGGARTDGVLRAFGPVNNPLRAKNALTGYPGDRVLVEDEWWIVAAETQRENRHIARTLHHRKYLLVRIVEQESAP